MRAIVLTSRLFDIAQRCRLLLILLSFFALLVGRFYWYGETTSWAAFIRASLFAAMLLALTEWKSIRPFLQGNAFAFLLLGFMAYLAANSICLGDGKTARRVALLIALLVAVRCIVSKAPGAIRGLLMLMVVVSAGVALFSIFNLHAAGMLNFEYRRGSIEGSGVQGFAEFENSILAALQLGFSCVTACWLLLQARGRWLQGLLLCCALAVAAYIYLTYGRTGWLATLAGCGIVMLFGVQPRQRGRLLLAGLAIGIVVVVVFHERLAYELFNRQLTNRDEIWAMVLDLMPQHWLFGHGADTSLSRMLGHRPLGGGKPVLIAHAHSIYMEVLFNYGLVGLSGFLSVLLFAGSRLWAQRKEPLALFWLAVLVGGALGMLFDFSSFVSTPNLVWLWFWLPVAWAFALSGSGQDRQITAPLAKPQA
ncbi:MAG: hypothetical protein DI599_05375 [Pseudomonas kuykendallii]|uniref:O-antigen ligase-related domain-containing protein n=1 Tax=Pseudomonas kuykendallii TaxID=1007099 RepID=A0A2W5D0F2_9PSED|nr:MAG: hypothetical protein DI599_05375 [Pseudomonas kuykendallii]